MKINIDDIFDQIIKIQVKAKDIAVLKDLKLDFRECDVYEISGSYADAYYYLCECLLMDEEDNGSQKLLELFLIHQYLCHCYLSESAIHSMITKTEEWDGTNEIIMECFSIYRMIGAFQDCVKQYEILKESELWYKLKQNEQMQVMKEAAKSYRNIGNFYQALALYHKCLMLNSTQDWIQRVELLLKIGKVYRNYLMQVELARFYVEEAYSIVQKNESKTLDKEKELRYTIICLDTLGQIYRDKQDYEKAKNFFSMSKKLYGEKGGRARIHEILMKYKKENENAVPELAKDIEFLISVITNLEKNPIDEIGIGVRSVQLGTLKYKDISLEKEEAYKEVLKGRCVALKYNDIKTVIRSYIEEANFLKQEKKYEAYIKVSNIALELASDNHQLVLENEIIKEIIDSSNRMPVDFISSNTKIELIKRRKDIYKKLIEFSKLSIDIVLKGLPEIFSKDKLIDMYGIVLNDFEQILGELDTIIEILNIEIEEKNKNYTAYLQTEIKGYTYKNILHKFKNDLPDENVINQMRKLYDKVEIMQPENEHILSEVNKKMEAFTNVITHIKQSAMEALKEAEYEKKWCSLDALIRTGIKNYIYYKPNYKTMIQYIPTEQNIEILVQSTLFDANISEILSNAFSYVETELNLKDIQQFKFIIKAQVMERRSVILECYSQYWDGKSAENAVDSIKKGLGYGKSTKKGGSKYGLYSMKFFFEILMGGSVQILQGENRAGLTIQLPINLVTLRIAKGDIEYGCAI